jgi:regulatory protein
MTTCKDKALEYLSRFARTERQVADYLRRKGYPEEDINGTLTFLRENRLVDDRLFADSFIQSRIRHCDGPMKIRQMLYRKGVSSRLVNELLRETYPANLQLQSVRTLMLKRPKPAGDAGRRKLMAFIASRGFSRYVIIQAFQDPARDP